MNNNDYSTSFLVDQTPSECFEAINNVRGWWSEELVGSTDRLDAEFHYHFSDVHRARIKITEFIPDKKIVWHVVENYFKFTKDSTEWTGDDMLFEITEKEGKTEVRFTQKGLTPAYECYDICSNAWGTYITGSLRDLIMTGKGKPNSSKNARTENEAKILSDKKE